LFGLTLVARRRVAYGTIDPVAAREVFLREGLAADQLASNAPFLSHNRQLVAEVAELEHKARRQDVLVDDEAIVAFYAERVPAGIHSTATFERWRVEAEAREPRLLFITREALMRHAATRITDEQYPEFFEMAGASLPVKYRFLPGHPLDGLTLTVPLALLNQIDAARLSWLVPGMIREKITWYLKALPKAWRNRLTPVPEVVTAFLEAPATPGGVPPRHIEEALRLFCGARLTAPVPPDVWSTTPMPAHLQVNLVVVDAGGNELAQGRDLARLRVQLGEAAQLSFAAVGPGFERSGIRRWDIGDLPPALNFVRDGRSVTGYPALVDEGESVSLKLYDTNAAAEAATRAAVVRLIRIELKEALRRWEKAPPGFVATALSLRPVMAADTLFADVIAATCMRAFLGDDPLPRSESAFADQVNRARARLPAVAEGALRVIGAIATEYHALSQKIAALPPARSRFGAELAAQRDALVYAGFLKATPWAQLNHLPRYLQALQRRLAKASENPVQDAKHGQAVAVLWERYQSRADANRAGRRTEPALEAYRWLLEELKVSLFAQELRTALPVSYKRLEKAWAELSRG
jgi:ATP-dependent helicase HrpA